MSHQWPSFSQLRGGCKALEELGKALTFKIQALSQELGPRGSLKRNHHSRALEQNHMDTFILPQVICVKSCEPKVSAHMENLFHC